MITTAIIRTMKADDFPALEEMYYDFHEHHAAGVPTHLRHLGERDAWDRAPLRAALQKILADENAKIFVALVEECLAGLIEVYVRHGGPDPAVHPRCYMELQSLMWLRRPSAGSGWRGGSSSMRRPGPGRRAPQKSA